MEGSEATQTSSHSRLKSEPTSPAEGLPGGLCARTGKEGCFEVGQLELLPQLAHPPTGASSACLEMVGRGVVPRSEMQKNLGATLT